MRIMKLRGALVIALLPLFFLAEGGISAEPPKSQTFSAGRVEQVFAQTNSDTIELGWPPASPSGALAQMTLNLESASLLVITITALGYAKAPDQVVTQPNIRCTIDNTTPCQGYRDVYFRLANSVDSHSFTWIVPSAAKGRHTITIDATWAPARPAPPSTFFDRTLVVAAAKL
jgi:hypothetical protein